jgi:hypothetical protein
LPAFFIIAAASTTPSGVRVSAIAPDLTRN